VNKVSPAAGRFDLMVVAGVMTVMVGFALMYSHASGGILGITVAVVSPWRTQPSSATRSWSLEIIDLDVLVIPAPAACGRTFTR
jgi:hypothetical protein